jgi:hypothetical protein
MGFESPTITTTAAHDKQAGTNVHNPRRSPLPHPRTPGVAAPDEPSDCSIPPDPATHAGPALLKAEHLCRREQRPAWRGKQGGRRGEQAPAGGRARGELRDRDAELDETASVDAWVPPPARLRGRSTRHQAAETEPPSD